MIQTDAAGNTLGVAGSPLIVNATNALSASISGGSVALLAGVNVFGTACVIQGSPAAIANAWAMKITDGTDTAVVDAASRLLVTASLSDGLTVTSASVTVVENGVASPIYTRITDGVDSAVVDAASRLLVTASLTDGLTVTSASVTVVNNATACPIYTRLTDGIDNVAVDAASRLLVTASLSDGLTVSSASVTVINNATACPIYTRITDGTDNAMVDAASRLLVTASLTDGLSVTAASVTVVNNDATCPIYTRITDGTDNVVVDAASRLLTTACITNTASVIVSSGSFVVTNTLTASVIQSSPNTIGNAWPVRLTDTTDGVAVTAASELLVSVNNTASVIVSSGSVTVINALSASISNVASVIVSSGSVVVTNGLSASVSGGSVALLTGANVIGTASAIQGTAAAITAPWPVKLSDSVDSVVVDSTCRLAVALTDGTNAYGLPASPLSQTGQGQTIYWAGSTLTVKQIDISSSISGCTAIVASTNGFATVVLAVTFTTSTCQFIGWTACGNSGAASLTIQTRMPFGTNGGMDVNRMPHGYVWAFPSGSIAVITTNSACYVAGTMNYVTVAS